MRLMKGTSCLGYKPRSVYPDTQVSMDKVRQPRETQDQRRGGIMRKFFESGLAFMLVALVWIAVGLLSGRPGLGALGVFWLVLAIAVRARSTKKQRPTPESQRKDDAT